jgi:hypothetical protein
MVAKVDLVAAEEGAHSAGEKVESAAEVGHAGMGLALVLVALLLLLFSIDKVCI